MSTENTPRTDGKAILCGFCGQEFTEDRAQPACLSCPLARACHFVRCPHCGYDNPAKPGWLHRLGSWMDEHVSA